MKTLFYGALCACSCSMPIMLDGIIIRLSIMEREQSGQTQRISLFHDLHKADRSTARQQHALLESLYGDTSSNLSVILEMPEQQYLGLFSQLQTVLYTCAEALHRLHNITLPIKNLASIGTSYYERGPINEHLLYELGKEATYPYRALDLRSVVATLFDLALITALTPQMPAIAHNLIDLLNTCKLTTQDFFTFIETLIKKTSQATIKAYARATNEDTRAELSDLYYVLAKDTELFEEACQLWKPDHTTDFITTLIDRAQTYASHNLPATEHCAMVLGEPLFDLIMHLTKAELILWLADTPIIADLLNPLENIDKAVIVGASHAEHIMSLLGREGFTIVFDSHITLTTSPKRFNSFEEALTDISKQVLDSPSLLTALYKATVPLHKKQFQYCLKSMKELSSLVND